MRYYSHCISRRCPLKRTLDIQIMTLCSNYNFVRISESVILSPIVLPNIVKLISTLLCVLLSFTLYSKFTKFGVPGSELDKFTKQLVLFRR